MGSVRARSETGNLFFDFRYQGKRCRENTVLKDTKANRSKMQRVMDRIDAEIKLGTFVYSHYFPNSPNAAKFEEQANQQRYDQYSDQTPIFEEFSETWFAENEIRWKRSYKENVEQILALHLSKFFGNKKVSYITKAEILQFRASLAKVKNGNKVGLSADRINHIITILRMILTDAADRYDFNNPAQNIKALKVQKSDVEPFSLQEVQQILRACDEDFRDYFLIRFFTGMRTGEIDGLKWKFVDFDKRLILIRETIVNGEEETGKTIESFRDIQMSTPVYEAFLRQKAKTGNGKWVFVNCSGNPLDHRNVTKRIWYPLLKKCGLSERRPYQTRHTAATLWLAAGESPEWIARQMGHTTAKMLFQVYSRYVPNLTRQDGSAFESLLNAQLNIDSQQEVLR
jgi:integrase